LLKHLLDDICAVVVHRSYYDSNEFIKFYLAAVIVIKGLEETVDVFAFKLDSKIMDALAELVLIEKSISSVIGVFELALETSNSLAASVLKLEAESLNKNVLELRDLLRSLYSHSASSVLARLASTASDHRGLDFSLVIGLHLSFLLVRHFLEKLVSSMVVRYASRFSRLVVPVGESHRVFIAHLTRLSHGFIIVDVI
jgi:hypothetical protein